MAKVDGLLGAIYDADKEAEYAGCGHGETMDHVIVAELRRIIARLDLLIRVTADDDWDQQHPSDGA